MTYGYQTDIKKVKGPVAVIIDKYKIDPNERHFSNFLCTDLFANYCKYAPPVEQVIKVLHDIQKRVEPGAEMQAVSFALKAAHFALEHDAADAYHILATSVTDSEIMDAIVFLYFKNRHPGMKNQTADTVIIGHDLGLRVTTEKPE